MDGKMRRSIVQKMRQYGTMKSTYGCCSLRTGVLVFSTTSLLVGVGLLLLMSIVNWQSDDIVRASFNFQREIKTAMGWKEPPQPPNLSASSTTQSEDVVMVDLPAVQEKTEKLAFQLDPWIKKIAWIYALVCTMKGVIG